MNPEKSSLKDRAKKHRNKIIGAILLGLSFLFPPVQALLPEITAVVTTMVNQFDSTPQEEKE